ncbi:MAG: acylphosphatase [Lachnospiraceae bacterium]
MSVQNIIRKRLVVHGQVQGVGFRYRARYLATSCDITGWVRNEWDGTVVMEVQGSETQLQQMSRDLSNTRFIHVDAVEEEIIQVQEFESGFHIHY